VTDLIEAAERALRQWDLGPASVEPVSRSENIVFRVDAVDGHKYVLRMHRPGYHSYDGLVSEQLWTAALTRFGVDVPIPRATRRGEPYGQIQVEGETRFAGVLEWVEGIPMGALVEATEDVDQRAAQFSALGELLASLHAQAASWQIPSNFSRHALDADGLMGEAPFWGPFWRAGALTENQKQHFSALRQEIHTMLRRLPKDPDQFSLIHADLHPGNVVVDGERLHVIDFDDAAFGWHIYDFAVALKNYEGDPEFSTYQTALISGYRRQRQIDDEALALIPLFLLIRALNSIGWADARPELGHPEYGPGLAKYVEERAESVLSALG
jgi:Ser/Thr protein kinase RdoA (MazF antagonist)